MSLSRAFIYAGAKSILSSLWRIDDQFTSSFVQDIYEGLDEGLKVDEALWSAKKKAITEGVYDHPYYWASFIPIGNMEVIELGNNWSFYLMGMGLVGLGLMLLLWRYIRS